MVTCWFLWGFFIRHFFDRKSFTFFNKVVRFVLKINQEKEGELQFKPWEVPHKHHLLVGPVILRDKPEVHDILIPDFLKAT